MADYRGMYNTLFNAQTDILQKLRELSAEIIHIQRQVEDIYINASDAELVTFRNDDSHENALMPLDQMVLAMP